MLTEENYQTLLDAQQDAYVARLKAAVDDVKAGRVKRFSTVDDIGSHDEVYR